MYNNRKILYTARGRWGRVKYTKFEFIVHLANVCICKQNTNLTVSNTFNIKSEFTACAQINKIKVRFQKHS